MNEPEQPMMLPLEYAAQIVFELECMRRECSEFANRLLSQRPLNECGLEQCAKLDDALARAHGILHHGLGSIKLYQTKGRPEED
jgi:hypothetical protein